MVVAASKILKQPTRKETTKCQKGVVDDCSTGCNRLIYLTQNVNCQQEEEVNKSKHLTLVF